MTNKQHNQQLGLIDAHLRTLEYELAQLQRKESEAGNFTAFDKIMMELEAARAHCRQFQL